MVAEEGANPYPSRPSRLADAGLLTGSRNASPPSARARWGPVPPPAQPTDFKVELNSNGSITLKWKARHPEGSDRVVYFVKRKLIRESAFRLVGGSGEKSYQDDTLPIGIDGASYIITAQRGNVQGQPSRQLTVTFGSGGVGGQGGMRVDFTEAKTSGKLAA